MWVVVCVNAWGQSLCVYTVCLHAGCVCVCPGLVRQKPGPGSGDLCCVCVCLHGECVVFLCTDFFGGVYIYIYGIE